MAHFRRSGKYDQLIELYRTMARDGYSRLDAQDVSPDEAFSDNEIIGFKHFLKPLFQQYKIKTVMDYGAGGSGWDILNPEGYTFKEWMGIEEVYSFEPSRNIDERRVVDAVLCFDVLEHVYAPDVPYVVDQLFQHARKMVIANVALYPAAALLPNGENAHITLRSGDWWKGVFDTVGAMYPDIHQSLLVSPTHGNATAFKITSPKQLDETPTFTTASG